MRTTTTILGIIHERGQKGLPLERVYRLLFNRDLYLLAYGKIYRNHGAMTQGITSETVDEMSLKKIDTIIETLRQERYRWTPTRRVYVEKKRSTKKRPLSMPIWSDKLLQEVIRLILEAYYEPQFSPHSHGFRPGRGCHTALQQIETHWHGVTWFVEGDIKACFDSISHDQLLAMLAEKIHDGRFLRLISGLLAAGYLEDWNYHATYSGAPQGGIVSPILSNIYLSQLDKYMEETLIPQCTKGGKRKANRSYDRLLYKARGLRKGGHLQEARKLRQAAQKLPSVNPHDPDYRRLKYVRYADDFLLGFIGPKAEAEQIKHQIKTFLRDKLQLDLSEEKTLLTHARTQAARFLSYQISVTQRNSYHTKEKRSVNGVIWLAVPPDLLKQKCQRYQKNGKPIHRPELLNNTVFSIVAQYQAEYRGFAEYYQLAHDRHRLSQLKWIMHLSLLKTLAAKLKISVNQVFRTYRATWTDEEGTHKGLEVTIPRPGKQPLVARWGGISLKRKPWAQLVDYPTPPIWGGRSELEKRLLADTCELCGSQDHIEVHHIRALKDLDQKGRSEKPHWVKVMAARRRKTLVVCQSCHQDIHAGRPLRRPQS